MAAASAIGGTGAAARGGHLRQLIELRHEAPVDEVLELPDPRALEGQSVARAQRIALSCRDQVEGFPLRLVSGERPPLEDAPQVPGERPAGAYGVDPRFGRGVTLERGDVTGGEHLGVRDRLQCLGHPDEAFAIEGETGAGQPRRGCGGRGPEHLVEGDGADALDQHGVCAHFHCLAAGHHAYAPLAQELGEPPAHARRKRRQQLVARGDEGEGQPGRVEPCGRHIAGQAAVQGQQQLDAAGAAADHPDLGAAPRLQHPRARRLEAIDEAVDGLDGDGVLGDARDLPRARRRADVDRQDIVEHRWPVLADHLPRGEIEADRLAVIEASLSEAGERPGVDVCLVVIIKAGDHARQHAGIGRIHLAGDEGEAHTGHRVHAEHAQYADMGMSRADEHDVLQDRCLA